MQILVITFPSKLLLPPDVAATCLSLSLSFKTLKLIHVSKLQPGVVAMGTKGFVFTFRKVMLGNSMVIQRSFTIAEADCECIKAPLDKGSYIFVATAAFILLANCKKEKL